jgi:UDP-glucose-4-epimerase GalE
MASLSTPKGPVLIAGGAGYIGSHAAQLLMEQGVETVVFDDLSAGHRGAVRGEFVEGDLADKGAIADAIQRYKPVAAMHFAGKCYVGESVTEPGLYYQANVVNSLNLLRELQRAGVRDVVFSSTCATYGQPDVVPIPDDAPLRPITPYGQTKLDVENILRSFKRAHGMRHACLRYFNAAGASPDGTLGEVHIPETHLIPLVLEVALGQRDELKIFGQDYPTPDGTCVRDYIHVCDLAQAHLNAIALLQSGVESLTCNLGTGQGFSVLEIVETAREVTGHPIPVTVAEPREGDPAFLISGGTLAESVLGWTPQRADLRTIIEDAWRFKRAHPDGYPGSFTEAKA